MGYVPDKSFAQRGEDLELAKIFKKLGVERGFFVDVGAWDGFYLSNTQLFVKKGWKGVEIEGNPTYADKARRVLPRAIQVVTRYIKANELDAILALHSVPEDFDLLSIDIDSYDYWVWANLKNFNPGVVIIESNSREGIVIQAPDTNEKLGSSPQALRELAESKGYKEKLFMEGNIIFVRKDLYDRL